MPRIIDPRKQQSFDAAMPEGHWERISCRDASCGAYARGWVTVVPTGSDLALAIRSNEFGLRHFQESIREAGMSQFSFPQGQTCFQIHQRLVRPPTLTHRQMGSIRTLDAEQWIETWNEESYKVNHEIEKG